MSFSFTQVNDITNKWDLAERLTAGHTIGEQALKRLYTPLMQCFEKELHTSFESSIKEKIWSLISETRIKTLQEVYTLEFCQKILGGFSEEEAGIALEEHKRLNHIENEEYCARIRHNHKLYQDSVNDSVIAKANGMTKTLLPVIGDALKKEGLTLLK